MRLIRKIDDVRRTAYSMPLTNPSFPPGPYRFFNREYFVITYRTDPEALAAVVPEPLEVMEPVVKYEFIRMPDSTGFGDYTETGQVIPVRLNGEDGAYTHAMYLDDDAPIAGGRELWGFPKKRATPKIEVESDVLVGTLHYGPGRCAASNPESRDWLAFLPRRDSPMCNCTSAVWPSGPSRNDEGEEERGKRLSPHQHVPELPGIAFVDVLREQSGAVGQRRPVGVNALYRAKIRHLDLEAAAEIQFVGLDHASGGSFQ